FVGGGFTTARAIVNLHVRKNIPEAETDGLLPRFVERREIRGPWIGLLTSAWTEKAVVAEASGSALTALAVVTVGLSNRIAAGRPAATLLASIAAHGGAVSLLFVLTSGESHPSVLFVDLEALEERAAPVAGAGSAAGGGGEAKRGRDGGRSALARSPAPAPAV